MSLADNYGRATPKYVAISKTIAKTLIDEESKLDAVPEGARLYYGALCNPPKDHALYKVGKDGVLVLLAENFDDET